MTRRLSPRLQIESLESRTVPALFTVTSLNDSGAGTLRDAITQANASPDADTISFDSSLAGGTVNLTTIGDTAAGPSALLVSSPITIDGEGQTIARSGSVVFRMFLVSSTGHLILRDVYVTGGYAVGGAGAYVGGGGGAGLGGGIYNQGTLEVYNSTVEGKASGGSAQYQSNGGRGGGGLGGPGDAAGNGGGPNGGAVGMTLGAAGGDGGFGGGGGAGDNAGPFTTGPGGAGGFGGGGGLGAGDGGFGGGSGGYGTGDAPGTPGFGAGQGQSFLNNGTAGGGAGMGGAIFNQGGTVKVANSTIHGEAIGGPASFLRGGGENGNGLGGGIFNLNGSLTVVNTTIVGRTERPLNSPNTFPGQGDAIYNLSLNVGSVTDSQNASVSIGNSILVASTLTGATAVVNHQINGFATFDSVGPNLATVAAVNTGGQVIGTPILVADPLLGPLQNNGGLTPTYLPADNSPVLNIGSDLLLNPVTFGGETPTNDQRGVGFSRVRYDTVDLGAVEILVNTAPRISGIANPPIGPSGRPIGPLAFTVEDDEQAEASLVLTATSSNTDLLPVSGITFGGEGTDRTITLAPIAGRFGTATITVTVTDPKGLSATTTFTITIVLPQPALVGGPTDGAAKQLVPSSDTYAIGNPATFFAGLGVNVRTATGDLTGDGIADLIGGTGPGTATQVVVLDGATFAVIATIRPFEATFTGGVFVAAGDVDGDGRADVIVTPDRGGGPVVAVYRGAGLATGLNDNAQLVRFLGIEDANFRGGARAAVGDLNGDGKAEIVVSAGFLGGPRVSIVSGASVASGSATPSRLIGDFFAFEDTLRNGVFVALGDVNGDGRADLAIGAGPGGGPRVRVVDGRKLLDHAAFTKLDAIAADVQVRDFFAGPDTLRGGVRVALHDLDGNGFFDLLTGSGDGEPSRVRTYLAANLSTNANPTADQELNPFDATLTDGVYVG